MVFWKEAHLYMFLRSLELTELNFFKDLGVSLPFLGYSWSEGTTFIGRSGRDCC